MRSAGVPDRSRGSGVVCAVMAGLLLLASSCGWAADPQIADRLAIEQVWAKYAQALDTADPQAYASLWTASPTRDAQPLRA